MITKTTLSTALAATLAAVTIGAVAVPQIASAAACTATKAHVVKSHIVKRVVHRSIRRPVAVAAYREEAPAPVTRTIVETRYIHEPTRVVVAEGPGYYGEGYGAYPVYYHHYGYYGRPYYHHVIYGRPGFYRHHW